MLGVVIAPAASSSEFWQGFFVIGSCVVLF